MPDSVSLFSDNKDCEKTITFGLKALHKRNKNLKTHNLDHRNLFVFGDDFAGYIELSKMVRDGVSKDTISKVLDYVQSDKYRKEFDKINTYEYEHGLPRLGYGMLTNDSHRSKKSKDEYMQFVDDCYSIKKIK